MQNNEVAIVILSCDKFKITWKPCIDHFFHAWPDCRYQVYLLNNFISSGDSRVIDLMVGEDLDWSNTLKKGLLKINEERVFFIFDDCFITQIDHKDVKLIFKMAIENDLDSVALRRKKFGNGKRFNDKLFKLQPKSKYRNSLFLNLIKKNLLLDMLKPGEDAWQFEKEGNIRNKKLNFYSVYEKKLISFYHGIVKGKWMSKTLLYLKNQGYALEENNFENHSRFQELKIDVYTLIFYAVQKFLHLFK